jgi:hypothetical protein
MLSAIVWLAAGGLIRHRDRAELAQERELLIEAQRPDLGQLLGHLRGLVLDGFLGLSVDPRLGLLDRAERVRIGAFADDLELAGQDLGGVYLAWTGVTGRGLESRAR